MAANPGNRINFSHVFLPMTIEETNSNTLTCWRRLVNMLADWRRKIYLLFQDCLLEIGMLIMVIAVFAISYKFQDVPNPGCKPANGNTTYTIVNLDPQGNKSPEPCDNFAHFACENWHKENPRQNFMTDWNIAVVLDSRMNNIVMEMLEEPYQLEDIKAYEQAQIFYQNCTSFKASTHSYESLNMEMWYSLAGKHGLPDCVDYTKEIFKFSVGQKYLRRLYNDTEELYKTLGQVEEIYNNIKEQISGKIAASVENSEIPHFDFQKFQNVNMCLGFPSWIFNDTRVQEEENELLIIMEQSTFPEQLSEALKWGLEMKEKWKNHSDVNADSKGCHWNIFPGDNFPQFHRDWFQIYIPMGAVESYYTRNGDTAMNYGSLGFWLGHELSHALYDLGLKTNGKTNFTSFEICLKEQYNRFTVKGMCEKNIFVDGERKLYENYADNGGLQAAYLAYKQVAFNLESNRATNNTFNESDQYDGDQRFFLGYARTLCQYHTYGSIYGKMELSDGHSPNMFRVFGPLQNSDEFSKAWNCSAGSKMNPYKNIQQKCLLFPEREI